MSSWTLLFLDLGFQELAVVMIAALLLYGGRLPEVARSFGRTVADFKRSAQGLTREFRVDVDDRRPPRRSSDETWRRLSGGVGGDRREDVPPRETSLPAKDEDADRPIGPPPRPEARDPLPEPTESPESSDGPESPAPRPPPPGTEPRQG